MSVRVSSPEVYTTTDIKVSRQGNFYLYAVGQTDKKRLETSMDKDKTVNTPVAAVPQTDDVTVDDDSQAKIASLEAEKAKHIEEIANWKMAALKAKADAKSDGLEPDEDERMAGIARKALAESRLAEIAREQDGIIQKALKENKELKLAVMNKSREPGAAMGSHTETTPVQDTVVTSQQMEAFKARGWDDKKIERYKKNLIRYSK